MQFMPSLPQRTHLFPYLCHALQQDAAIVRQRYRSWRVKRKDRLVFLVYLVCLVCLVEPDRLEALTPFGMEKSTPLWFYLLKEAELMENGLCLGPVGGRIVGEVFIGLLKADESSYLAARQTGYRCCRLRHLASFA